MLPGLHPVVAHTWDWDGHCQREGGGQSDDQPNRGRHTKLHVCVGCIQPLFGVYVLPFIFVIWQCIIVTNEIITLLYIWEVKLNIKEDNYEKFGVQIKDHEVVYCCSLYWRHNTLCRPVTRTQQPGGRWFFLGVLLHTISSAMVN